MTALLIVVAFAAGCVVGGIATLMWLFWDWKGYGQ
jgi:hypothetical protein